MSGLEATMVLLPMFGTVMLVQIITAWIASAIIRKCAGTKGKPH
jgi:hypothetical protein